MSQISPPFFCPLEYFIASPRVARLSPITTDVSSPFPASRLKLTIPWTVLFSAKPFLPLYPFFHFDSRLFLSDYSSNLERDRRDFLKANYMHHTCLAGLTKSQAHLDPSSLRQQDDLLQSDDVDPATVDTTHLLTKDKLPVDTPIRPVYAVPNSQFGIEGN
jgi:hypothetical protein